MDDVLVSVASDTSNPTILVGYDFTSPTTLIPSPSIDKGNDNQAGAVYDNVLYYAAYSADNIITYDFATGVIGSIALSGGTSAVSLGCVTWGSLVYFLEARSTSLALYSYDPSTSTLTLLNSSITGQGNPLFVTDGVYVYTYNNVNPPGPSGYGSSILYQTNITTNAVVPYTYWDTNYASIGNMVLDPSSTYLYITYDHNGNYVSAKSINVSTMTLNTNLDNPQFTTMQCDAFGRLWYAQIISSNTQVVVGYYTSPNFTGGTSVTLTVDTTNASLRSLALNASNTLVGINWSTGTYYIANGGFIALDVSTMTATVVGTVPTNQTLGWGLVPSAANPIVMIV